MESERAQAKRSKEPAIKAWNAYVNSRKSDWGERHLDNHLKLAQAGGKPKTRGRKKGEGDKTEPGPLHELLQRPLSGITPEAVRAWLEKNNATRPTWTAQGYRALRAFLNWCASQEDYKAMVQLDACTAPETRRKVAKNQTKDDCLQREQLSLWFEHVRKLPNPVHAAYLQTLLLTGSRREELAGLKWEDVDFQWGSITIRDKVEGARTIPLTPYVASLLAPLARRNEWVFSSLSAKTGRLQEPRDPHNKALAAAGLPHLSLHGLRRSFGTLAEWVECPAGVSAQIMGHKPSAIAEKHYRRRPLDLLRQWHTKIEGWILAQAGIEQPIAQVGQSLRVVA
jgi:integrase